MPGAYKDNKFVDQVRDYMAAWLIQDFPRYIITVGSVSLSGNRKTVYVWIKSFVQPDDQFRQLIKEKTPYYRHKLAAAVNRRTIPNLEILVG